MKQKQTHAPFLGFDQVVNGRRVHLLKVGDDADPPIVLLYGCGSLAQEALAPFRNAGLHIVAPDRSGYGFNDPLPQGQGGPLAQSLWPEELPASLGLAARRSPAILSAARRLFFWRSGGPIW